MTFQPESEGAEAVFLILMRNNSKLMPDFCGVNPIYLLLLSSNTCEMLSVSSSETQHPGFLLGLVMWHLCLACMKTLASRERVGSSTAIVSTETL